MKTFEGLLNIDKPAGMTSHDVVRQVRRIAKMKRVGHTGTLDPMATGVLVVCLGRATRLAEYVQGQTKTYVTTVRLGQTTNTYDADGEILQEKEVVVTRPGLTQALTHFTGTIQQVPPMYSAIKKDGQPLYKLARQGQEIERPARTITIYELDLLKWQSPNLELRVVCSTGTYIRSLAYDLGGLLGCGGHLTALRRTQVGQFTIDSAVPLDKLSSESITTHLLPPDEAVAHFQRVDTSAEEAKLLGFGQTIGDGAEKGLGRVYDPAGQFIGIVRAEAGRWQPHKMMPPNELGG